MSDTTHLTGPETGTDAPKPPRKRHRVRNTVLVVLALGAIGGIASGASGGSHPAASTATPPATSAPAAPAISAPAKPKPAAAYPAEAADKALCDTYNADLKSGDTASIQAALDQAGGSVSPGLAKDIGVVASESGTVSQDEKNMINVAMDCALVSAGVAPGQGFSSAPAAQAPAPATSQPAAPATQAPAAPAGPTTSQQQALDSAQSYLSDGQGFSRAGLIKQLTSKYGEGFSQADATWAVDHSGANWYAQAVTSAKSYMSDGQGFSRASLIEQLTSPYGEQFTYAQATYAADHVGL